MTVWNWFTHLCKVYSFLSFVAKGIIIGVFKPLLSSYTCLHIHKAFEMHRTESPVEMKQNSPLSGYPSRPLTPSVLNIPIFSHASKERNNPTTQHALARLVQKCQVIIPVDTTLRRKSTQYYRVLHPPKNQLNSVARVRERTIPTERPPLFGEASSNFCW
jgi:hypothetical protein